MSAAAGLVLAAAAALQDGTLSSPEQELRARFAEPPSAADVRRNRRRKNEVLASPDAGTVLEVGDAAFFAALDRRSRGMGGVLAEYDAGRVEEAWLELDRFLRSRWRARADVRQVVHYAARVEEADRGGSDPVADDLARGVVVARGVRFDLAEGGWTQRVGQSSFAGLHYWEWGKDLWQAYVRTGREEYAAAFDRLFNSWYEARQDASRAGEYDVIWYELGLAHRPLMLARLLYAMRESPALTLETRKRVLKTLLGSANQLQAEEECGYTSGNFQMFACNSLYQLGLCLPMFQDAGRWRETGKLRLVEHVFWDFNDDGGHSERAHGYSQGTLLRIHKLLLHARDDPDPGPAVDVIRERVREIELWFLRYAAPTGELPGVNDSGFLDGAEWLKSLAWHSGDGRFLWPIRDRDGLPDGVRPTRPDFDSVHLAHDGWTILRDGWERESFYLLVNWGRWGSSHTHASLLDVNAYAFGRPMVVEAGHFGGYDNPLDAWFRSPEAHNQVVLRERELERRSESGRVVRWRRGEHVEYFEAWHDGYRRSSGLRLRRQILFVKGEYWLVIDTVEGHDADGGAAPSAALLWHAVDPWRTGDRSLVSGPEGGPGVQLVVRPELAPDFVTGYEDEPQELYGSRYGAAFEQPAVPGASFVSAITPFDSEPVRLSLAVEKGPSGLTLRLERDGTVDHVVIGGGDGRGPETARGDLRSDGVLAWAREDPLRAAVIDGARAVLRGRVLVEAAEPRELLEVPGPGPR